MEKTNAATANQSTLKADIVHFVKFLTVFALVQAVVVFLVGLLRGNCSYN